jgi:hypothetical protein
LSPGSTKSAVLTHRDLTPGAEAAIGDWEIRDGLFIKHITASVYALRSRGFKDVLRERLIRSTYLIGQSYHSLRFAAAFIVQPFPQWAVLVFRRFAKPLAASASVRDDESARQPAFHPK